MRYIEGEIDNVRHAALNLSKEVTDFYMNFYQMLEDEERKFLQEIPATVIKLRGLMSTVESRIPNESTTRR